MAMAGKLPLCSEKPVKGSENYFKYFLLQVFYGGKTYTAIKEPKRNSSKLEKRDNFRLNQLSLNAAKAHVKQRQADNERLEKLNATSNVSASSQNKVENCETSTNSSANEMNVKKERSSQQNIPKKILNIDLKTTQPIVSRLHLLKKAGERMLETGKITRVSGSDPGKK